MFDKVLLQTDRIRLRNFKKGDLPFLHGLNIDEDVMRHIRTVNYDINQSKRDLAYMMAYQHPSGHLGYWLAEDIHSSEKLGTVTLRTLEGSTEIELGYRWKKSSWGRGYATETCKSLINYAFFQAGFRRVVAVIDPDNQSSERVLIKCGFQFERMAYHYKKRVKLFSTFQSP